MPTDSTSTPRYFAMELAEAFLADMHPDADDEQRERVIDSILCAGQHLADCGHPGDWSRFDADSFLPKVSWAGEWELVGVCLDLSGLFGWMGFEGMVPPARVAAILTELRAAGPQHPLFTDLCEGTAAAFRELSAASGLSQ